MLSLWSRSRHVQHTGDAESDVSAHTEPPTHAEHDAGPLHAVHAAVPHRQPRDGTASHWLEPNVCRQPTAAGVYAYDAANVPHTGRSSVELV